MENRQELLIAIQLYLQKFSKEKETVQQVLNFIAKFDGNDLYNRINYVGHITASAFIYHPASASMLMIQHKALNRWLQPGGHIERNDANIYHAALREAIEETGIEEVHLQGTTSIFDINSHGIPANAKKAEPAHVHHDIRYLFTCENAAPLQTIEAEVADCKWISLTSLAEDPGWLQVIQKIKSYSF
jgi:8-oxo-dGTP pyrophosphatase MutT (NUDIX family)